MTVTEFMFHNSQCFSTYDGQYSDFLHNENEINYFDCVNYSKVYVWQQFNINKLSELDVLTAG